MPAIERIALVTALAFATGACHAAEPAFGGAYAGEVEARVSPPGKSPYVDRGKGSARFHAGGLDVIGAISDPRGDTGFRFTGAPAGRGWEGRSGDVRISIDDAGRISGGGLDAPQRFTLGGRVTPTSFDLVVDVELVEANRGGLPRGTRMRFTYDLAQGGASTTAPRAVPAGKDDTQRPRGRVDKSNCRKIQYVVKPVPDPAGGTLVMRRVPVCRD